MAKPLIPKCGGCGTCDDCRRAELDIKAAVLSGAPIRRATGRPNVVERVVVVGPELELWQARTLERPILGQPTRLLVSGRGRLTLELARYSEGREPGTWHRPAAPS